MNNQDLGALKKEMKNICTTVAIIVIVFLVSLIVWVSVDIQNKIKEGRYIGQEIESKNTISVTETGEVFAKPDLAVVTFTVTNEAKTVNEALATNTNRMNDVIAVIKDMGVEEKDLKTTSFNIYPRYEWYEREACIPPCPTGKRVLVGYEVRQSLEVKIRDMGKIGGIIRAAAETGANQVGDLQFTIDKEDELKKEARKQAVEKAKAKAEELASLLGVNLVRVTNFQESGVISPPRFMGMEEAVGLGGEEVPQIETGENIIRVTVTITYEIN